VERLGPEQLVQLEIDAIPVVADGDLPEPVANAVMTARLDAHAGVTPGDLCEVAVTTEGLRFFDLATRRAIRDSD
jgi:hypothetical protein